MKKLTLQQIFDTGVNGVLKQRNKSYNDLACLLGMRHYHAER